MVLQHDFGQYRMVPGDRLLFFFEKKIGFFKGSILSMAPVSMPVVFLLGRNPCTSVTALRSRVQLTDRTGNRRPSVPVYRTGLAGYRSEPDKFKFKFKLPRSTDSYRYTGRLDRFTGRFDRYTGRFDR